MGKLSVYVRLRPSFTGEKPCVEITSPTSVVVESVDRYCSSICEFVCDGIIRDEFPFSCANTIIVAYGHSGSGKTRTIFETVFDNIEFIPGVEVSFLEVYNENVCDLLNKQLDQKLSVCVDASNKTHVPGLTRVAVRSVEELNTLVNIGLSNRIVASNAIHSRSSRSHAILQIGNTWLVDLAGSEIIGIAAKESKFIHQSLHALQRCILALKTGTYVPARASVLTRLLFSKPEMNCMLIACIAPEKEFAHETLATLEFANSSVEAKQWSRTPPTSETEMLKKTIAKLRQELAVERNKRIALEDVINRSTHTPVLAAPKSFQTCSKSEMDESVLSQTWRHDQYDAILQKCWGNGL